MILELNADVAEEQPDVRGNNKIKNQSRSTGCVGESACVHESIVDAALGTRIYPQSRTRVLKGCSKLFAGSA